MTKMMTGGALDYAPCQYGMSKLVCRGPRRVFDGRDHIAVLGGIETFGAFVEQPFPDLLERRTGIRCVNLGAVHSGPDAWMADDTLLGIARDAILTVIVVPGAHLLSNKFYTVHSRRNDRVVRQTPFLRAAFPELDLSQHFFVRHLLGDLQSVSTRRFSLVRDELRRVWMQKMNALTARIGGDVVLAWMGDRGPDDCGGDVHDGDPPFVTRAMLRGLRGRIRATVEVLDISDSEDAALHGKVFAEHERTAACRVPGPGAHIATADRLTEAIGNIRDNADPLVERIARRSA